jgi:hypothetical protein
MSNIRKTGIATPGDAHVDAPLTRVAIAYKQSADSYLAGRVFPSLPVQKQSDKIGKFDKNDWKRNQAKIRAPGTESAGGGFAIDFDTTYFCDVHAFHQDIPRETMQNSDIRGLDIQVAEFVTEQLLIDRERDFVTNYFATGVWADQGTPDDATGSTTSDTWPYFKQFDDGVDSDPLGVIRKGRQVIHKDTGFKPNTLIVGQEVHDVLALHPDIMEVIKYTETGIADLRGNQRMAALLGVDRYFVGESIYASNVEGETEAYAFNFGKNMLLCYVPPRPGYLTPASGYVFEWTGLNDLGYDISIDRWPNRNTKSVRIEGEMAYDAKILGEDLGVFFSGAVA